MCIGGWGGPNGQVGILDVAKNGWMFQATTQVLISMKCWYHNENQTVHPLLPHDLHFV